MRTVTMLSSQAVSCFHFIFLLDCPLLTSMRLQSFPPECVTVRVVTDVARHIPYVVPVIYPHLVLIIVPSLSLRLSKHGEAGAVNATSIRAEELCRLVSYIEPL